MGDVIEFAGRFTADETVDTLIRSARRTWFLYMTAVIVVSPFASGGDGVVYTLQYRVRSKQRTWGPNELLRKENPCGAFGYRNVG